MVKGADNPSDVQSKLVLLTLAFPRLKIIWSSSPYQTALIFAELKKTLDEPDPIRAVQIGLDAGEQESAQTFSQVPRDMLRSMPGVSEKVANRLVLECGSLWELSNWSEGEISELVGKEAGRQIYRFLNRNLFD